MSEDTKGAEESEPHAADDCSRETLIEFAERDLPTYPEGRPVSDRFAEFREVCAQALPAEMHAWIETIDPEEPTLPEPEAFDGMAARIDEFCPGGIDANLEPTDRPRNERLNEVFEACGLESLGFVSERVFQEASSRRAATVSVVVFRWLVDEQVDEEIARDVAAWLGGMGEEMSFGVRELERLVRHHPNMALPVTAFDSGTRLRYPPIVVGPRGVWRNGQRVLNLGASADDRDALARHLRRNWRPSSRTVRDFNTLHCAVEADAPYELLPQLVRAAIDVGYDDIDLFSFSGKSFEESGRTVDPGEVDGHFEQLPVEPKRTRTSDEIVGRIRVTRRGHEVDPSHGTVAHGEECSDREPTICLADPEADDLVDRYDWPRLYRVAAVLHERSDGGRYVELTADEDLPLRVWMKTADLLFNLRMAKSGDPLHTVEELTGRELEESRLKLNREGNGVWMLRPTLPLE